MGKQWGWHLMLDCAGCNDNIKNREVVAKFAKEMVVEIDMVAYGEPIIEHFANHDPSKGGFTLVQLIETSAITAHMVDATGEVYLDIFSCKDVPVEKAKEVVIKYFAPQSMKERFIPRQA